MTQKNKSGTKGGSKRIVISCEGAGVLDYKTLKPFQGNLKTLTTENYERLKRMITEHGFTSPIHVWRDGKELYTLDGHQRCRVLELMEKDGFEVPPVPVSYVNAKSFGEAKRILLSHASQYGQIERQGLYEFITDAKIEFDELVMGMRLPEIDFNNFGADFFEQAMSEPKEGATEFSQEQFSEFQHSCPKCGFQFDSKDKK